MTLGTVLRGPTDLFTEVFERRIRAPEFIAEVAAARVRRDVFAPDGRLFVIAADAAARGVIGTRGEVTCLAKRHEMLARVATALSDPAVDGVLSNADFIDDLLVLDGLRKERGEESLLDGRLLVGCMNRGGLLGSVFELDDTFTGYTVQGIVRRRLDSAKVMLRIDPSDPGTGRTLLTIAQVVEECSEIDLPVFFEVFPVRREADGRYTMIKDTVEATRSVAIASGVASDTSKLWLKIPPYPDLADIAFASACPIVVLGGDSTGEGGIDQTVASAMAAAPNVCGCMVGRRMLWPADDDVAAVVRSVGAVVHPHVVHGGG